MEIIINIFLLITLWNIFSSLIFGRRSILYCGMVGFSGSTNFDVEKIKQLFLANMPRGVHSTGMYNDGEISKLTENAIEFLAINNIVPAKIFMGHDRHATVGNKSDVDNAHPFKYGTIVGQHNGTLRNHWELCRKSVLEYKDFDVDSQVLIALINEDKDGLVVLQEFEGAAALIWHDEDIPNRIYCFRNSERPLFRGMLDGNMYISSIKASLTMIGCQKVLEFKENYVYAIEDGAIVLESSKRVIKKAKTVKKLHGPSGRHSGMNSFNHNNDDIYSSYEANDSKTMELDTRCHWVQYIASGMHSKFSTGEWVKVESDTTNAFVIRESDNITVTSDKKNFSLYESLHVNGYVVVVEGDDKYFKTGEVLFLRGLELSENKKYTNAVLEKIEEDDSSYTWGTSRIRNATQEEIDSHMFGKKLSELGGVDGEELSKEETDMFVFENDTNHLDPEGNRLGGLWVEVGSTYETLIKARQHLAKIGDELQEVVDGSTLIPKVKESLNEVHTSIIELYDLTENELEEMFDKLYELYKG